MRRAHRSLFGRDSRVGFRLHAGEPHGQTREKGQQARRPQAACTRAWRRTGAAAADARGRTCRGNSAPVALPTRLSNDDAQSNRRPTRSRLLRPPRRANAVIQ